MPGRFFFSLLNPLFNTAAGPYYKKLQVSLFFNYKRGHLSLTAPTVYGLLGQQLCVTFTRFGQQLCVNRSAVMRGKTPLSTANC